MVFIWGLHQKNHIKRIKVSKIEFDEVTILVDVQKEFKIDIDISILNAMLARTKFAINNNHLLIALELDLDDNPHLRPLSTLPKLVTKIINSNNFIFTAKNKISGVENLIDILVHFSFKKLNFFGGYISQCLIETVNDTSKKFEQPIRVFTDSCFEEISKNKESSLDLLNSLLPRIEIV